MRLSRLGPGDELRIARSRLPPQWDAAQGAIVTSSESCVVQVVSG